MKLQSSLTLLGAGAIAVATTIAISQPSHACSESTATHCSDAKGVVVVPVQPTNPCAGPELCAPQPVVMPPVHHAPVERPIYVSKDYFFCGRGSHGVPTTFVNTPTGNTPLVRWVSHHFAHSGYTPEARCQEVSQRFNLFYQRGTLNYITTGIVNNQPVVCVASDIGGPCTGVLFTLKPKEDATQVVQQLFDVRAGAAGPLHESGSRIYIDMRPYTQAAR